MRSTLAFTTLAVGTSAQGFYNRGYPSGGYPAAGYRPGYPYQGVPGYGVPQAASPYMRLAPAPMAPAMANLAPISMPAVSPPAPPVLPSPTRGDRRAWEYAYWNLVSTDDWIDADPLHLNWNYGENGGLTEQGAYEFTSPQNGFQQVVYDTALAKGVSSLNADLKIAQMAMEDGIDADVSDRDYQYLQHGYGEAQADYLLGLMEANYMGVDSNLNYDRFAFSSNQHGYNMDKMDFEDAKAAYLAGKVGEVGFQRAKQDMMYSNVGMLQSFPNGGGIQFSDQLNDYMAHMETKTDLERAEEDYDAAYYAHAASATPVNFYNLHIAELELEIAETDYQGMTAATYAPGMFAGMNGNYAMLQLYDQQAKEKQIALLEEKIVAEEFKEIYGYYPKARSQTRASRGNFNDQNKMLMMTLMTGGQGPP